MRLQRIALLMLLSWPAMLLAEQTTIPQRVLIIRPTAAAATTATQTKAKPKKRRRPTNAFFSRNGARSIFSDELREIPSSEIKNFREKKAALQEELQDTHPELAATVEALPLQEDSGEQKAAAEEQQLKKAEQLISKFGDPTVDAPVHARGNAPDPFAGMQAALDSEDLDLAWEYAKQYIRYRDKQKDLVKQMKALQSAAKEAEGLAPEGSFDREGAYGEYAYLIDRDKAIQQAKNPHTEKEDSYVKRENPNPFALFRKTRKVAEKEKLVKPKGEEEKLSPEAKKELREDQMYARAYVRQKLAGKIPVDPRGEVQMYFFFNTEDAKGLKMASELERLYRNISASEKVHFAAVTIDPADQSDIDAVRYKTKITYPVLSGVMLAKRLGVKESPTTVFYSPSTGKSIYEEGVRQSLYLEEVVRLMRGGS